MNRFTLASGLCMTLFACSVAPPELRAANDDAVAKIDGVAIPMSALEELVADQLEQLEQQRHQLLENAVGPLVEKHLLENEAKSRGVTVEQLLAAEVQAKMTPVSEAEIDQWYNENRSRIRGTKEELVPQIRSFLEQQRSLDQRTSLLASIRTKHDVEILFEPFRIDLTDAGATTKGAKAAPVTIVEFSDFQCPACKGFNPTLAQVQEAYGDKVRVVFRQYPLRQIHPEAQKAAEASLCARDQDKFWELHDHMFANQDKLAADQLKQAARTLGLNAETFDECLDSGRYEDQVQTDLELGAKAGVSGTPSVYVNGRPVGLGRVPSFPQLTAVIDEEIERAGD